MQKLENNKKQSIIAGSVAEVRKLKNLRMSYGIACLVEKQKVSFSFYSLGGWCDTCSAIKATSSSDAQGTGPSFWDFWNKRKRKKEKKQQIILYMNAKHVLLLQ